jgi:hypothetical protein
MLKKFFVLFLICQFLTINVSAFFSKELDLKVEFIVSDNKTWYLNEGEVSLGEIVVSNFEIPENNKCALHLSKNFPSVFVPSDTWNINEEEKEISFSQDHKTVVFECNTNNLIIKDPKILIFAEDFYGYLYFDKANDLKIEAEVFMEIKDNRSRNKRDNKKPYALNNFSYEIKEEGIYFNWDKLFELDLQSILIKKTTNSYIYKEISLDPQETSYLDTNLKSGENIKYEFIVRDRYYFSKPKEVLIDNLKLVEEEQKKEDLKKEEEDKESKQEKTEEEDKKQEEQDKEQEKQDKKEEKQDKKEEKLPYSLEDLASKSKDLKNIKNPLTRLREIRKFLNEIEILLNKIRFMRFIKKR